VSPRPALSPHRGQKTSPPLCEPSWGLWRGQLLRPQRYRDLVTGVAAGHLLASSRQRFGAVYERCRLSANSPIVAASRLRPTRRSQLSTGRGWSRCAWSGPGRPFAWPDATKRSRLAEDSLAETGTQRLCCQGGKRSLRLLRPEQQSFTRVRLGEEYCDGGAYIPRYRGSPWASWCTPNCRREAALGDGPRL
jgi:hypothetical protein